MTQAIERVKQELSLNLDDLSISKRSVMMYRHQLHFKDYPQEMIKETKQRLLAIAFSLGLSEPPTLEHREVIMRFLLIYFPESSMHELSLAAELYLAERLQVNVEHYNQLSPKFVARLMTAYQKFRIEQVKKMEMQEAKEAEDEELARVERMPEPERKKHYRDKKESLYWTLVEYVKKYSNIPMVFPWADVYDFLKESGGINLSAEQKQKIRDKVMKNVEMENLAIKQTQIGSLIKEGDIQLRCKKEAVSQHLQSKKYFKPTKSNEKK